MMDEIYRTVNEQTNPVEAHVDGKLPAWLKGSLLRNGPGKYEVGSEDYKHWFDGLGMLHNFHIDGNNGKVFYSSRFVRSQAFVQAESRKSITYAEFGTPVPSDPCRNIFARFFSYFVPPKRTDNCSINVINVKGKPYAASDSPFLIGIDPDSLQALSTFNMRKDFPGPYRMFSMTPHPHEDPDGTTYNVTVSLNRGTRYNILRIPSEPSPDPRLAAHPLQGTQVLSTFVPKNRLAYYHSFAMTPNYFVFVENPFVVNLWALLTMKVKGRSFHECMTWENTQPSRFYLIERKTGKCIAKYQCENFFSFHHVNAYETETEVHVDICCYPDARIVYQYYLQHLRTKPEHEISKGYPDPALRRYRVPIPTFVTKKLKHFHPLPKYADGRDYKTLYYGVELPQINYRFANGKPYRYVYGTGPHRRGDFLNQLLKVDVLAKEAKKWHEHDCIPSEPVFVPSPGAESEDEGVILSSVVGSRGKRPFLLVLDAKSFKEIARATLDRPIAHSLHGAFRPRSPLTPGQCKRAWMET